MKARSSGSDLERAKETALRLLSYRARSVWEIRMALKKKGFDGETIESTVKRLEEVDLLNDRDFASRMASHLARARGYGRFYIAARLKKLGVAADVADEAVKAAFTDSDEKETALKLLARKTAGQPYTGKEKGRIGRYLHGRGFSWETIQEVLKETDDRERDQK